MKSEPQKKEVDQAVPPRINLGLATVRDLLAVIDPPKGASGGGVYYFCDKVVVGGIMNTGLDEVPAIVGLVVKAIQDHMYEILKSMELAKLLGDVDRHLDVGGEDS